MIPPTGHQETIFFYLDSLEGEKDFTLRIDPNISAGNLKAKIAEKVAAILGGIVASDIENNIEISDGVTIVGESDCKSIADLRQIEHKQEAGKRDITAISVRILSH
jgi:hypothetical protein